MPWKSLIHEGVNFSPEYKCTGYVKYKKNKIILNSMMEEYLVYWYRIKQKHRDDKIVLENFISSCVNKYQPDLNNDILNSKEVDKQCQRWEKNFTTMYKISNIIKLNNKEYSVNNNVENPGVFIGKGNNPLRGFIKPRIRPEDIIINWSGSKDGPKSLYGKWKSVVKLQNSYFIACWKDTLFSKMKYIYVDNYQDDSDKFNKAVALGKSLSKIRNINLQNVKSNDLKLSEMATIVYLIDKLCIRVGHDKEEDFDNQSVGCCTLNIKNLKLLSNDRIYIDFYGKDYIHFKKNVKVDPYVYKVIKRTMSNKSQNDRIFTLNGCSINNYLNKLHPGLTAKMFRTCNASKLCQKLLKSKTTLDDVKYACVKVGILCNHKKQINNKYFVETNTSKSNYIDPRIFFAFAKKHKIEADKIFSPSQLSKHKWASYVSKDFIF